MNKRNLFSLSIAAFLLIDTSVQAESPLSGLDLNTFYTRHRACVLNEYENVNSPVNSRSACFAFAINSGLEAPKFLNLKNGFSYEFYTTYQGQDVAVIFYVNQDHQVQYFLMTNKSLTFGGPAKGECFLQLKNEQNWIISCGAEIIKDELANGSKQNFVYAAAINLREKNISPPDQTTNIDQAVCVGAILGALISGNHGILSNCCGSPQVTQPQPQPNTTNTNSNQVMQDANRIMRREYIQQQIRDTMCGTGGKDCDGIPDLRYRY